jgi:protein-disulfide isomerase
MSRTPTTPGLTEPIAGRDHLQGPETAPVTLLEYGDFECPYCGQAHLVVKELQRQFGDQLRFAFRHFPLAMAHPHAQHAAEAAEAAGGQGRFWEMHDVLYENQHALEDADLARYAAALGLDLDAFIDDLTRHTHAPRVREDFMIGAHAGVNGTPTFFINGQRHNSAFDFDTLSEAIESAMAATT